MSFVLESTFYKVTFVYGTMQITFSKSSTTDGFRGLSETQYLIRFHFLGKIKWKVEKNVSFINIHVY